MNQATIKAKVRQTYGNAAKSTGETSCCETSCCGPNPAARSTDPITAGLYNESEQSQVPVEALSASLGCGNPTALASLREGETVLDLGSGGGIDVFLAARQVGPGGKVYGLDMTDEMLELARRNQEKVGSRNVEFRKGEIEEIPLPDGSVDVIISNCVINLSVDKDRVFREAYRVLRPGGRLAVSDIVVRGEVPAEIRNTMELWAGCVAGALEEQDYRSKLEVAGFESIRLESSRTYAASDAEQFLSAAGLEAKKLAPLVDGKFASAFIEARKPAAAS